MNPFVYQVLVLAVGTLVAGLVALLGAHMSGFLVGAGLTALLVTGSWGLSTERSWGWWLSLLSVLTTLYAYVPVFTRTGRIWTEGVVCVLGVWVLGALLVMRFRQPASPDH